MSVTFLQNWSESRAARWSHFAIGVVAVVLVARLALEEDLSWTGWVVAGAVIVCLALVRFPYGALSVLIGMCTMPRYFVELFGWKVRPEHFAAGIISLVVIIWLDIHRHRIQLQKLDYWILTYVAINYVSSFVGSSEPSATLKWALQNNLAVLPYFLIRLMVQDLETLRRAFRLLLGIGIAEAVYGILCYFSYHALGTTVGMEVGQYLGDIAAPYGSLYEPNLFGAYTGCCAVLFLALYLVDGRRLTNLIGSLVASLAAVLSFSRATIVALVAVFVWLLWKSRPVRSASTNKWRISVLALGLALVAALTAGTGVLQQRFSDLYYQGLTEETAISRFIVMEEALQDIPKHPLLGTGTASFNLSFDWGQYVPEWSSEKTWIGNAPVRILHDCGILGLAALLGFLVSVWWKIRRTWSERGPCVDIALGLAAGTLLYAVSFQSTDGTILAFTWVHLGFFASAAILITVPGDA
jgi:hypothetical protein